jgi:hypothetical protein
MKFSILHIQNYNHSEHLATDEVREGCNQSGYPKETNISELKFTNSVTLMASHDTKVYLQKDRKQAI